MVSTQQKPTAPVASPNAKSNQPAARTTPPVAAARPTPTSGGPDPTCAVHRLEEALKLVESMKLTDDQKTKISELTTEQTARCTEARKQHKANHEEILALLTTDQAQTLQVAADEASHCHKEGAMAPEGHAVHA
jgi:Spy/CpxP family protein refolding chaperone